MADFQQALSGFDRIFIFGPAGGLSPQEVAKFEDAGGQAVGLGLRILWTETVPLYALSAVSYATELNR